MAMGLGGILFVDAMEDELVQVDQTVRTERGGAPSGDEWVINDIAEGDADRTVLQGANGAADSILCSD